MFNFSSPYANQVIDGKMSVWLQEYGWQAAKLGQDIKVGDHIRYNFGGTSEVVAIERTTPACIFVTVRSDSGSDKGTLYHNVRIGKKTWKPVVGA